MDGAPHSQLRRFWPRRHSFFAYRGSREAPGPGKFRVVGVSKTTREDVFLDVDAASQANAKAKAEIEGIVVTKVYRVPER